MHLFHHRPMAFSCMIFAAVVFLCYFLNQAVCLWLSLGLFLLLFVLAVLYFIQKHRILFFSALCVGMACVAALSSALFFHGRYELYDARVGEGATVEGTVLSVRRGYGGREITLALHRLDGAWHYGDVYLRDDGETALAVGDTVCANAVFETFASGKTRDTRAQAFSDGIFGVLSVPDGEKITVTRDAPVSLRGWMLSLREELSSRLSSLVEGEAGALCVAFLLGDRSLLSDVTVLNFREVGISHLLALSGMHVSIMIACLEFLLKRLGCSRTVRACTVIFLSLGYLLLTGCAFSTVRAVLMCCTLMLAFLFRANYDSFTALTVSLVVILLTSPWAVTDLGMWMSFLAAGSIVVFYPITRSLCERILGEEKHGGIKKLATVLLSGLFVGIVANVALSPIQGFVFGEISLLSIPATLLLSYPLTAVLVLSSLTLLFSPLAPIASLVATWILDVARSLSGVKGIVLPLNDPLSWGLLLLLALSLILIAVARLKKPSIAFLLPTVLWLLLIPCSLLVTGITQAAVSMEYVSEGRGEALVISQNGECIVADLSTGSHAVYAVSEALVDVRCTRIDELILTRYDEDSADMLLDFSSRVRVCRVRSLPPKNEREERIAKEIRARAASLGIDAIFDTEDLAISEITDTVFYETDRRGGDEVPILFSFLCRDTRVTYANADFCSMGGGCVSYFPLLEDSEVMIHGGTRKNVRRFLPALEEMHTLILKSEKHRDGFSKKQLEGVFVSSDGKYVFD